MIERPQQEIANATAEIDEAAHAGLVPQLGMMVRALVASPMRNRLVLLAVAVFLVIAVTAYGQIRLNSWNKPFYDALSRRDLREFIVQLGVFGVLAGTLLVLNVAQRWLGEMLKLKLREGLAHDLIHACVIADWRATLLRVARFRRAVIATDALHDVESRIAFVEGEPGKLTIENLEIASPAGCTLLQETKVEVKAGEHVLIVGEPGTGKTLLFRALAGLWPWGTGRVAHPKGEELFYMPRTPYLPPGTLREALAYPSEVGSFEGQKYKAALARLGLESLEPLLDVSKRWDRELNEDEQQRIAFASLVLHAPPWVLIDEALDSLDDDSLKLAIDVFTRDLKRTGVIYIGRADGHAPLFSRTLHLIKDPATRRLPRNPVAAAQFATA